MRASTVARKVAPESNGSMYVGSATARFANNAGPPVSKDGSTAMRLMARKKLTKIGACRIIGANDFQGWQSYLRDTCVRAMIATSWLQTLYILRPHRSNLTHVCGLNVRVANLSALESESRSLEQHAGTRL